MTDVYDRKQQHNFDVEKSDPRYSDSQTPPKHYESYQVQPVTEGHEEETKRSLKPRQISMIAIGGAIGECRFASRCLRWWGGGGGWSWAAAWGGGDSSEEGHGEGAGGGEEDMWCVWWGACGMACGQR
jgi:hypothetical protein